MMPRVWKLSYHDVMLDLVMHGVSFDIVACHGPSTLHKQAAWLEHAEDLAIDLQRVGGMASGLKGTHSIV